MLAKVKNNYRILEIFARRVGNDGLIENAGGSGTGCGGDYACLRSQGGHADSAVMKIGY